LIPGAVAAYRRVRHRAERNFGIEVPKRLETEVAPALPL
jgi:hypothetical protein